MNRSLAYIGIGVIVAGLALASYPLVVNGVEKFDIEQEAGVYIAPVGLVVILLAAVAQDPRKTTVRGAFGNPDERPSRTRVPAGAPPAAHRYNSSEAASCRFCRTFISPELAQCPRCARARDCRSCGRPLGIVLERATCPRCALPEAICSCAILEKENEDGALHGFPRGW